MNAPPTIQVTQLWKRYGIPPLPWRRHLPQTWALQDISFELHPGETLGIIGVNGSGKSTLLKVLAGITAATRGQVTIGKPLFSMIELNAGIHTDLTGRENVRMLGAIMGLSRQDINRNMGAIEDFCELGPWFDRPVRMYSSGMLVRLGFSVSIHVQAEILLMDEILSVGDIGFQNKCLQQLETFRNGQGSILLVSHNVQRIRRICNRVLLLHNGQQHFLGKPDEAIHHYHLLLNSRHLAQTCQIETPGLTIESVQFLLDGQPLTAPLPQGSDLELEFVLALEHPLDNPNIQVALENSDGVSVIWESMEKALLAPGLHTFRVTWQDMRLRAGRYQLRIGVNLGHFSSKGVRLAHPITLDMLGSLHYKGVYQPQSTFIHLGG